MTELRFLRRHTFTTPEGVEQQGDLYDVVPPKDVPLYDKWTPHHEGHPAAWAFKPGIAHYAFRRNGGQNFALLGDQLQYLHSPSITWGGVLKPGWSIADGDECSPIPSIVD